ncbi:MAG: hypothetical protein M3Y65_24950 [Pseudomonadota bacterium]|nr:hypothetical protein [Pseudomonadota bacterium]
MPAYKPKKTQLLHERFLKCGAPFLTEHGGWDNVAKAFIPLPCYATFKDAMRADGLNYGADAIFLDAFTAGVEEGDLDAGNWMRAFEEPDDWRHLAEDLAMGGPRWLNERARQALQHVLAGALHVHLPELLSGLEGLGRALAAHFEHVAPPTLGALAPVLHLRLVKPS